jgi:hypothetical protein
LIEFQVTALYKRIKGIYKYHISDMVSVEKYFKDQYYNLIIFSVSDFVPRGDLRTSSFPLGLVIQALART